MAKKFGKKQENKKEASMNAIVQQSLNRINELEAELVESKEQNKALVTENSEKLAKITIELSEVRHRKEETEKEIAQIKKERDAMFERQLAHEHQQAVSEKRIEDLKTDVKALNEEKTTLTQKNREVEQNNKSLSATLENREAQLQLLHNQLEQAVDTAEKNQLLQDKAEAEARIHEVEKELAAVKEKVATWLIKFDEPSEMEREKFIDKVAGIQAMRAEAEATLEKVHVEAADLLAQAQEKAAEILKRAENQKVQLAEQYREELSGERSELEKAKETRSLVLEEVKQLEQEVEEKREQIQECSQVLEAYKSQVSDILNALQEARSETQLNQ